MGDKSKETEPDVLTDKKDDNDKIGITINDNGVRRSTGYKLKSTPYVLSTGRERKHNDTADYHSYF